MEKVETSSSGLWLPYAVVVAVMAVGVLGGPHARSSRPGISEAPAGGAFQAGQSIPARLWQDPMEATEAFRRALRESKPGTASLNAISLAQLIQEHTGYFDGKPGPDGRINYLDAAHRVLFQFVSMPADENPEASEQRIRARVAIVSALSTAGYRPANAARLGVAVWEPVNEAPVTSQTAYPYEVFILDTQPKAVSSIERRIAKKVDEVIVVYVEDGAIRADLQLEWLKRLSYLLAAVSPPERFTKKDWILARWLGPITSDRLIALLRSVKAEYAIGGSEMRPLEQNAVPVTVLAIRPTIEPDFVVKLVYPVTSSTPLAPDDPAAQFESALRNAQRRIALAPRRTETGELKPWLALERLGIHDALLTKALADELTLRRPGLFHGDQEGTVALLSEWDTLYGTTLPESFARKFLDAGGKKTTLRSYTYLRGLDGQVPGAAEKPKPDAAKAPDSPDLFRQVLKSRAPNIAFGRTQIDYVDRLAAQLREFQRAYPKQHLEAVGILGSDTYDKLLILQGLRKEFPSVLYFTTELDASLFAPENYDVTHNLLVATGFDLRLNERYQRKILPFRDTWQASIYFGTLRATEYFLMKQNQETVGAPLDEWPPAVIEIGRSGPYLLNRAASDASGKGPPHSPLPEINPSARRRGLAWLVPLVAVAIVLISTTTHYGRLAAAHAVTLFAGLGRQLSLQSRRRMKWTGVQRLWMRDFSTLLVILAATMFVAVAACIPHVATQPNEEPFYIAEGISSWPATWLRGLGVFLCACYFWVISWQFRQALARASREFVQTAPGGCPPAERSSRHTPCDDLDQFRRRSSGGKLKLIILLSWIAYVGIAWLIFSLLDLPALVTRGPQSIRWEKYVLIVAVFSINLLIVYAVVHNLSCSFFIRKVARWLGNPDAPDADEQPLHTALMRAIGHVAGAMTQMIYYPFTLLFLLMAARHPLFDHFDWPVALIAVFSISSGVLLASTLVLRRSADQARKNAIAWLERRIARLKWQLTDGPEETDAEFQQDGAPPADPGVTGSGHAPDSELDRRKLLRAQKERSKELDKVRLLRAEWQRAQVNEIGGAALSVGLLSNPLLRAVLIPLGGTGVLQLMEVLGKLG